MSMPDVNWKDFLAGGSGTLQLEQLCVALEREMIMLDRRSAGFADIAYLHKQYRETLNQLNTQVHPYHSLVLLKKCA